MPDYFLHGVEVVEIDNGPRPIRTVRSSVIGLIGTAPDLDAASRPAAFADDESWNAAKAAFPLNTPVLIAGSRREAAKLGATGTLPVAMDGIFDQIGAMVVVIRVAEGADADETMANIIGGTDASTGQYKGVQAFLAAKSIAKVVPRILIAPGFTSYKPEDPDNVGQGLANPVVAELIGIAERLKAVIIADGPNTNDADAINYRED